MIQAIYIAFCLLLAYWNKRRIAYDKVIHHWLNALLHACFWAAALLVTKAWIVVVLPLEGRLFFDTSLNLMRGLPLDYVSRTPKSLIDKVEKSFFKTDGLTPKLLYLILIIIINILFYGKGK